MKIYVYEVDNNQKYEDYESWDYYYSNYIDAWNACISYKDDYYKWNELNHEIYEVELDTNKTILLDRYDADLQSWEHGICNENYVFSIQNEIEKVKTKIQQMNFDWTIHNIREHNRFYPGFRNHLDSVTKKDLAIKAIKLYSYCEYKLFLNTYKINILTNDEVKEYNEIQGKCLDFINKYYDIPEEIRNYLINAEYANVIIRNIG